MTEVSRSFTPRHFYCALNNEEKKNFALNMNVSYHTLVASWFNKNPSKRVKPNHEQIEKLIELTDNNFSYDDFIDFYYNERK